MANIGIWAICLFFTVGCTTLEEAESFTGPDACETGRCIAYVNFRDTGLLQKPAQVDDLERRLMTCESKMVVLFVHGLQGSSRPDGDYVVGFRQLIDKVSAAPQNTDSKVVGIFIGWRGQSWAIPAMAPLTFGARRDAAKSVAYGQFAEVLLRVVSAAAHTDPTCTTKPHTRIVVIGHSLGGSIVFEAVWRDIVRRANEVRTSDPKEAVKLERVIDRVILVNPAIAAIDYAPFYEGVRRLRFDPAQEPLLEAYLASEDTVVGTWFSSFRRLETITYDPSERRELLVTPLGDISEFVTHQISALNCSSDAAIAIRPEMPLPVRVIRAEGVSGFKQHGDVWSLATDCVLKTLAGR